MRDRELLRDMDPDLVFLDPPRVFDGAILGVMERCGSEPVVAYSTKKILLALERGGMESEDALEHFEFNIAGAYVGPRTPMFLCDT